MEKSKENENGKSKKNERNGKIIEKIIGKTMKRNKENKNSKVLLKWTCHKNGKKWKKLEKMVK